MINLPQNITQRPHYIKKVGVLGVNEIDFVAEKEGEKWYIQVALSLNDDKTIEREFGNLAKIKDNYKKTVITLDEYSGNTYQGIAVTNLKTFCLSA